MVGRYRKWQINPATPGAGSLISRLLAGRGLRTPESITSFLEPNLNQLHDPFLLPDMAIACQTILTALKNKWPIAVHGDYDVDGMTATALLIRFLRSQGAEPRMLIPDRMTDGYGLSEAAAEGMIANGDRLLITVDCGVTSLAEISQLREAGIRVVVTDHHECGACLPEATAVVNPRRADSQYPFAGLAGVGVTLKLVQALCGLLNCPQAWQEYLDLAALGTVADVVPLIDENRCLTAAGLAQINHGADLPEENAGHSGRRNIGLDTLLQAVGQQDRQVTAQMLGFSVAPRLNAAGRLGDAYDAISLLLTDDQREAERLAEVLIDLNRQRQDIENIMTQEAIADIDNRPDTTLDKILVVYRKNWHSGVIGIVASRLAEHYARPVIVLAGDESSYKGSCRSWGDIDILAALRHAAPALQRFGGHRKAAGLTLAAEQLSDFLNAIAGFAASHIADDQLQADLQADLQVTAAEMTLENARDIQKLEPFGEANPVPLLVCRDLLLRETRLVGSGRHLKLKLQDPQSGLNWDAIAFGLGEADEWTGPGDRVDVLFSLEINNWQGRTQLQLNLRDLRPADSGHAFYDRPWEAERLYQDHGSLHLLVQQMALSLDELLPRKQEYKAVYQYLRMHYTEQSALIDLTLLARKISRSYRFELHPFRLARILVVFQETGLIKKRDLGPDRMQLKLLPVSKKVRLEESRTYRSLIASEGGGST